MRRQLSKVLFRVAIALAALLVVVSLLLQIGPIRTWAVNSALTVFNPYTGGDLQVESTAGSVFESLQLEGLRLSMPDGTVALEMDTLYARYRLLPMLVGRYRISEVRIAGLRVSAERDSMGVLNLAAPFVDDGESAPVDLAIGYFGVARSKIRVRDGAETWSMDDLELSLRALRTLPELELELEDLRARLEDPASGIPGLLTASGRIALDAIQVDTLTLETSRSRVMAGGRLGLPDLAQGEILFEARAEPLHFDDLRPLIPELAAGQTLHLSSRVRARQGLVDVTFDGIAGGGEVHASVRVEVPDSVSTTRTIGGALRTDEVDLSRLLSAFETYTPVQVESAFELSGEGWAALSGTAALRASGTVLGIDLQQLVIDQAWEEGIVALEAEGFVRGGRAEVRGTMAPFQEGLPIDLTGSLRGWLLQAWTETATNGLLSADFTLAGSMKPPRWRSQVRVRDSRIGLCPVAGKINAATTREGELRASLDLEACEGTVSGRGSLITRRGELHLAQLDFEEISPTAVLGDTTFSSITARLQGRGTSERFDLAARVMPSRYGAVRLDSLSATATARGAGWHARGKAWSGPGEVSFKGDGSGGTGQIESLIFSNLDIEYTANVSGLQSRLSGSGSGSFRPAASRFALQLLPSGINDFEIRDGQAIVAVSANSVVTTGALRFDTGGRASWAARARPDDSSAQLDSLRFVGLDLSRLVTGIPPTDLEGLVHGDAMSDTATLSLVLDPGSSFNDLPLGGGSARLEVSRDSIFTSGSFQIGSGFLDAAAGIDRLEETFAAQVRARSLDALRVAGRDTTASRLSAIVRVHGRGLNLGNAAGNAFIDSLRFTHGDVQIAALEGELGWTDGVLVIDSLTAVGSPVSGTFHGRLPLGTSALKTRYEIDGNLRIDDVQPLARLMGVDLATAAGQIAFRGSGQPNRFQLSADGSVSGIRSGDLHVADSDIVISVELGAGPYVRAAEARLAGSIVSLPGVAAESAGAVVTLVADSLGFRGDLVVDANRSLSLSGSSTRALNHVHLSDLHARLDDSDWSLLTPANIWLDEGIEVDGIVATADSQRIALGGIMAGPFGDDFYLAAEGLRIDAVADLAGFPGLGATLNTTISITSAGAEEERNVSGTVSGFVTHQSAMVGQLDGRLSLRDGRVSIDTGMIHTSGSEARIRGFIPFSILQSNPADDPVSVQLQAADFPVDWLLPFLDPAEVDRLSGFVSGDITIRGSYGHPELGGVAEFSEGLVGIPLLGRPRKSLVYDNASAFLTFRENAVVVESAYLRSGSGFATASGTVDLQDLTLGEIDLSVTARDFLAVDAIPYRVIVGANLEVGGTTVAPRVGGRVQIERGDFYLTEQTSAAAFEPVSLSREDLLALEERFAIRVTEADTTTFDFYEAMQIQDLRIDLARNSWLRSSSNPAMNIQFTGSLDVSKAPYSELDVFGSIDVLPERSHIDQFGRRFNIEQGTLTFRGPVDEPEMNMAAVYEVRSRRTQGDEVTIRLSAVGRPEDLTVTFQSDPAMELSDIISYIATGRPASESLQFGGTGSEDYLRSAAGLAVGPITSLAENLASAELGLDLVEIQQDEANGFVLTAGKYVSPRFFVSVSQPLAFSSSTGGSDDATELAMEYEIVRHVLASLLSRGTILRVNLRWERAY